MLYYEFLLLVNVFLQTLASVFDYNFVLKIELYSEY